MEIRGTQPFIFRDVLFAHGWLRLAPFSWDEGTQVLRRVEQLPSGRVVRIAFSASDPDALQGTLDVQVLAPTASPASSVLRSEDFSPNDREAIAARARWIFCLDENLSRFHRFCAREPGLRRAARRRQGRILRSPTVFEEVVKTLCCVNTRWPQSVKMARLLVDRYGPSPTPSAGPPTGDPRDPTSPPRAFPPAAALATADPREVQEVCRLGYRAARVVTIARRVVGGDGEPPLDLEALRDPEMPGEEILARLRTLPGVGPYAGALVLNLLGRHEFLALDSWVRDTARRGWFGGRTVSDREIAAAFDRYHPYQSLVYRFFDWDGADRGFRQQVGG